MPIGREQIRCAFAAIFRRCLTHSVPASQRSVVFTETGDSLFSGQKPQDGQIFVFLLKGKHQVRHYHQKHLTHTTLTTQHVLFMDTDCPASFTWQHPCQRLGIALNPNSMFISWNRHIPPADAKIPNLLYTYHQVPPQNLTLLFNLMTDCRNKAGDNELAKHTSHLILLATHDWLSQPQPVINDPLDHHRLICDYIDRNLDQPLDREIISSFFHLHPDYISHLFAQKGTGFVEYLHLRRMQYATDLLKGTHLPIHQIAIICGYNSSSYFIKMFRDHYKNSPGQYRQLHLSNHKQ